MLNPDNDGKTALELAIDMQRPKTFELLLNMLIPFNEFCFSKMLIPCMPKMIKLETAVVARFFDNCVFKPSTMMEALTIPWPEGVDEMLFASNSSIVTKQLVLQELNLEEENQDDNLQND